MVQLIFFIPKLFPNWLGSLNQNWIILFHALLLWVLRLFNTNVIFLCNSMFHVSISDEEQLINISSKLSWFTIYIYLHLKYLSRTGFQWGRTASSLIAMSNCFLFMFIAIMVHICFWCSFFFNFFYRWLLYVTTFGPCNPFLKAL